MGLRAWGLEGPFQSLTVMALSASSGLFRSLQQAQSVSSQDLLIAVDACEELLQEVDITPFLLALCGHTRGLPQAPPSPGPLSPGPFSSSIEEGPEPRERAVLASESRLGRSWNDVSGLHEVRARRRAVRGHAHTPGRQLASCSHLSVSSFSLLFWRGVVSWVRGRVAGCHQ